MPPNPGRRRRPLVKPAAEAEDEQKRLALLVLGAHDSDLESVVSSGSDNDSSSDDGPGGGRVKKDWLRGFAQRVLDPDIKGRAAQGTFVFVKPAHKPGRHFYAKEELQRLRDDHAARELREQLKGQAFEVTGEVVFDKHGEPEGFEVLSVALPSAPGAPTALLSSAADKAAQLQGLAETAGAAVKEALGAAAPQEVDRHSSGQGREGVAQSLGKAGASAASHLATGLLGETTGPQVDQPPADHHAPGAAGPLRLERKKKAPDPRARLRQRRAQVYSTSEEDEEVVSKRRAARAAAREALAKERAEAEAAKAAAAAAGEEDLPPTDTDSDPDAPLGKATANRAQALVVAAKAPPPRKRSSASGSATDSEPSAAI